MISHLHLKTGSSAGSPPLVVDTPPSVTIFVGPNNSGKSQALREISSFCNSGQLNTNSMIVEKLTFAEGDKNIAQADLDAFRVMPNFGEHLSPDHSILKIGTERSHIHSDSYIQARTSPNQNLSQFTQWHLRHLTLNLDGPSRISLINPQGRGDLKNPTTSLARLLTNDTKRSTLRKIIYDSLNLHFAIDMSEGSNLHVRFGNSAPPDERTVRDETLDYLRAARGIEAVSDGVKAYTGILLQLHAGNPKVIIIDEPEAFLHPALAQRLGKELAKGAAVEGKNVFVSTHSPQFVMGAILSGAKVNIIRLTFDGDVGTARLLPSSDLTKLMQDPLLRSVGVLAGLFYNYVIVGEADADRAFYQEINERLLAADDPRGIPHALFLNADNKQTIPKIVAPLRKLGIPVVGIADIDILKDGGLDWTRQLEACNIPATEHQPFGTRRASAVSALEIADPAFKTSGGLGVLSGSDSEAANNLIDDLARYGLFVVRRGEVESWLSKLGVNRGKHTWLRSIFEKMGSDPISAAYVKPDVGDVWDFVGEIRKWLIDPKRRGIPI